MSAHVGGILSPPPAPPLRRQGTSRCSPSGQSPAPVALRADPADNLSPRPGLTCRGSVAAPPHPSGSLPPTPRSASRVGSRPQAPQHTQAEERRSRDPTSERSSCRSSGRCSATRRSTSSNPMARRCPPGVGEGIKGTECATQSPCNYPSGPAVEHGPKLVAHGPSRVEHGPIIWSIPAR